MVQCSDIKGSSAVIKLKEESVFGEFSQNGYKRIPFNTFNLSYSRNEVESDTIAAGRAPSEKALGDISVEGDITFPLDDVFSHYFLKGIFGIHSAVAVGDKTEHTYTISDGCLPSFAFEKSFTDTSLNYLSRGVKMSNLSIELGGEGQINGTVSAMGKSEELRRVSVDAIIGSITADANINSKTLEFADASSFSVGMVITPRISGGTLAQAGKTGETTLTLQDGEGSKFKKGTLIEIEGTPFQVISSTSNKIVLNIGLDKDASADAVIYIVENSYKIDSITDNSVTINQGLKDAVVIGDQVYGKVAAEGPVSQYFEQANITLTSSDSDVVLGSVQTLNFSLDNTIEGLRTINSKGSYGKLLEGKVAITCELSMIFEVANAKMLEEAKAGKIFDLKIELINSAGNSFEIYMPNGKLTPTGPAIEGPGVITASVSYSPFGTGITAKLINSETY